MHRFSIALILLTLLATGKARGEELKIMSYNIRYNSQKDTASNSWDARKESVVHLIEREAPDVAGLQEPRTAQREYLKQALPGYEYLETPGTGDGRGGNTCLIYRKDKFRKINGGWFFLGPTPQRPSASFDAPDSVWRVSVWVKLRDRKSGKEFTVVSTHLPVRTKSELAAEPYVESRYHSSQLNVARLKKQAGESGTCFVVGDMNCSLQNIDGTLNYDGIRALAPYAEWMHDARKLDRHPDIYSYNAFGKGKNGPHRRIDHIFYRNARPLRFETITAPVDGLRYVSDHYPVMLTCEY